MRLCDWPIPRPRNWVGLVNAVQTEGELDALRRSVRRGCPFGDEVWQQSTAKQLGLEFTLRPRERPRESTKRDFIQTYPLFPPYCSCVATQLLRILDTQLWPCR